MRFVSIQLLAIALPLFTQAAVQLGIEIEPRRGGISEADSAVVTVRVASDVRVTQPEIVIDGGELLVRSTGTSTQLSLGAGAGARHDITHRFALSGKSGSYTIKARVRDAAGGAYDSDTVDLEIRPRTAAEMARDPELHIRIEKSTAFVGEPILGEIIIVQKTGTEFRAERGNVPVLGGTGFTHELVRDPYHAEAFNGQKAIGYAFRATPLKAGEVELSAEFKPEFIVRSATGRARLNRFSMASEPQVISVKPLPTEGKPPDFSGAVGSFSLEVAADPLELGVGEPIAIKLVVGGRGNFDAVSTPQPASTEGWTFYNATRMDLRRGDRGAPDQLEFAQNIVPGSPQTEIPAFRLSAFDPKKEQYVTLLTDPIPITVSGSAVVPPPAPGNQGSSTFTTKTPPDATMNDILITIPSGQPSWASASQVPWAHHSFWWMNGGLAAGLLLLALIARFSTRKSRAGNAADFNSLLAALEHSSSDAATFYSCAQRCVDALRRENGPELDESSLSPIEAKHGYFSFSGDSDASSAALPREERDAVIGTLRSLRPQNNQPQPTDAPA